MPIVAAMRKAPQTGVSMVELLIVLTIAAILLAIGTAAYRNVTASYRISSEINGLLGDMQYARSEAIKQGQNVAICVSTTGTDCAKNNTNWNLGWIVVASSATPPTTGNNAALVLRAQAAFSGTDTLTDGVTSYISFDREGLALGLLTTMSGNGGAVLPLHDAAHMASRTRCLQVTNVGNVSVQQPATLATCS
jgi:type IV fimbrial biogenesis protein FimT